MYLMYLCYGNLDYGPVLSSKPEKPSGGSKNQRPLHRPPKMKGSFSKSIQGIAPPPQFIDTAKVELITRPDIVCLDEPPQPRHLWTSKSCPQQILNPNTMTEVGIFPSCSYHILQDSPFGSTLEPLASKSPIRLPALHLSLPKKGQVRFTGTPNA